LYVGNLPFSATEEALTEAFTKVGNVDSVKIISDRATGRSKVIAIPMMALIKHGMATNQIMPTQ
jgi:hypothetical protein